MYKYLINECQERLKDIEKEKNEIHNKIEILNNKQHDYEEDKKIQKLSNKLVTLENLNSYIKEDCIDFYNIFNAMLYNDFNLSDYFKYGISKIRLDKLNYFNYNFGDYLNKGKGINSKILCYTITDFKKEKFELDFKIKVVNIPEYKSDFYSSGLGKGIMLYVNSDYNNNIIEKKLLSIPKYNDIIFDDTSKLIIAHYDIDNYYLLDSRFKSKRELLCGYINFDFIDKYGYFITNSMNVEYSRGELYCYKKYSEYPEFRKVEYSDNRLYFSIKVNGEKNKDVFRRDYSSDEYYSEFEKIIYGIRDCKDIQTYNKLEKIEKVKQKTKYDFCKSLNEKELLNLLESSDKNKLIYNHQPGTLSFAGKDESKISKTDNNIIETKNAHNQIIPNNYNNMNNKEKLLHLLKTIDNWEFYFKDISQINTIKLFKAGNKLKDISKKLNINEDKVYDKLYRKRKGSALDILENYNRNK
jgi:hypothetical protein